VYKILCSNITANAIKAPEAIAEMLVKRVISFGIPEKQNRTSPTMVSIMPISKIRLSGVLTYL
jgi:hypothetical protein